MIFEEKSRMIELIEFLNYHQDLYDRGTPQISDSEWDAAYLELKELETLGGYSLPNSPTQKIRYTVVNELKKVKHDEDFPMLSLDKTKEISDIEDKFENKQWVAMYKCDGLSCRLIYQNGRLLQASTRGNGEVGEDITHNARVVKNIPKHIPHEGRLVVDGEIICKEQDFAPFAEEYANSRNFAAGSIRLLNSAESAKRNLSFIAWDCIYDDESETNLLSMQLEDLAFYGFEPVGYGICEVSVEEAIEYLKRSADAEGIPIDGIVFKLDNKSEYHAAGTTSHHPSGALSFKFYDEEYETELLDLEYTMGRTGVLSPVAIYKTIEIDGTECSRASLHNLNTLTSLLGEYPYVGQKVKIFKANQIIPQVSGAIRAEEVLGADPGYYLNDPEIKFLFPPKECPICGAPTEIKESDSGTLELYCSSDTCSGKLINQLEHFCSKKGLDIKGLSKATLEKLIDWGWVSSISDICALGEVADLWASKPGFGPKSVTKLIDSIWKARETTLAQYLSAISIPLIGKTYAQKLADTFETYEEFRNAVINRFDFESLDGIGPEKADAIRNFDYSEADNLVEKGIITFIKEESALENSGNALEGKTFCVTGKIKHWKNRDELSAAITAAGGKVTSSVSSKTSYLVNNDINSTSSKNLKAKELNIPIITEEELLAMFN